MEGIDYSQPSTGRVRNIVLVGRSGNGKSATGNSILGARLFNSMSNSTSVTTTSELQTRVLQDGQTLHVIDTPGFIESIEKEVAEWIHMAEGGLHAFLIVFSLRNRFTDEEKSLLLSFKSLFGENIYKYMIVVFTCGDDLEENGVTLDQYLARGVGSQQPLLEFLDLCNNRAVVFDNRTEDEKKKAEQIEHLLAMVNKVMDLNGGRSFSNVVFEEMKRSRELSDLKEKVDSLVSKEEMLKQMKETLNSYQEHLTEYLEKMFNVKIENLEQQLAEERASRLKFGNGGCSIM